MRKLLGLMVATIFLANGCGTRDSEVLGPYSSALSTPSEPGQHLRDPMGRVHRGSWVDQVIYDFASGTYPSGPLSIAPDGSYYGTTIGGGASTDGTVYKVTASGTLHVLQSFDFTDGFSPETGVTRDASGNLYGTTFQGGASSDEYCQAGCGVAFSLVNSGSGYHFSLLHKFGATMNDGEWPSGFTMDSSGNLFGTTEAGGPGSCRYGVTAPFGCGTVYKLTKTASGFTYRVIYDFQGGSDGGDPVGGVAIDSSGNVFGTTSRGGHGCHSSIETGCGTVFELTPSGSNYTKTTIYEFGGKKNGDGAYPQTNIILDSAGFIYGTTQQGGGTVYKLIKCSAVTCAYPYKVYWLDDLSNTGSASESSVPSALVEDSAGHLYGTTTPTGYGAAGGTAFEVNASDGSMTTIFEFGNSTLGLNPSGSLVIYNTDDLYGVTESGGSHEGGTIYQLANLQRRQLSSRSSMGAFLPIAPAHRILYSPKARPQEEAPNLGAYRNQTK